MKLHLICIVILLCLPLSLQAETKPAKVGALLMLSGDFAQYGKAMLTGMRLAAKEYETSGIELIPEDTNGPEPADSVTALKNLTERHQVVVVLNMIVNTAKAISPILQRAKIPGIIVWDSNKEIESLGDYIFGFGYSTELAGEDLAELAASRLNLNRIGIISMADSWSEVVTPAFENRLKLLGRNLVFSEQVSPSHSDFRSFVPRLRSLNADGVFLPLYGAALTNAIKQLRIGGFKGVLLTGDSMSELEVEQSGTENAEGMYVAQMWREDPDLEKRYLEINPEKPSAIHLGLAALGYDAYICVSRAIKKVIKRGSVPLTGEKLRDQLQAEPCQGIAGEVDYRATRISTRRERILKVSGGKLLPVSD